jgi:hypothetical protein
MRKKSILATLATATLLFGDYYSSVDTTLSGVKSLKYEDGVIIRLQNDKIDIKSKYNLDYLLDGKDATKYQPIIFTISKKVPNPKNMDEEIEVQENISYNAYNLKYILKNDIFDEKFVLNTSSGLKIVAVEIDNTTVDGFVDDSYDVTKYKYIIEEAFDTNGNPTDIKEDEILTKYVDQNGGLIAVEFLDDGVKNILKVEDDKLREFLREKSKRAVTVDKFDFAKDKLYLSYVSDTSSSSKRLNITYEMSKKNIKTVLESPVSLFDPEDKSSQIEQNIAILRNYKNKELFEIKKVQLIDNKVDISWLNHPKKKVVVLNYMTDGVQDKTIFSKSKRQQFYGIEGVFYLATWMDRNNIKSKIFTFINGTLPFDVVMRETEPHHFLMQKNSQTIFDFVVDDRGFLKQMRYPNYDLEINLESIQSDTTIANKQFLKSLKRQNNIKLIKE